jgi:hypothetical protein
MHVFMMKIQFRIFITKFIQLLSPKHSFNLNRQNIHSVIKVIALGFLLFFLSSKGIRKNDLSCVARNVLVRKRSDYSYFGRVVLGWRLLFIE